MKSSIEWFTKNSVAANLCMLLILLLGFNTLSSLRKELLPNISLERINIQSELAGASSEIIEASICKPIENRIYDIQGTLDLTAYASKGLCSITIDVDDGFETKEIVDEIKTRLNNSNLLPDNATDPEVTELQVRNRVMKLIISGNPSYSSLTQTARRIRNDLLEYPEISIIDLEDIKPSEIRIQISSHNIEKYNINFDALAKKIQQQSDFLPGGILETSKGDILISGDAYKNTADGYRDILVSTNKDGSETLLGDIANITDNRYNGEAQATFDGYPAVSIDIYRVGNQSIIDIAKIIDQYINTLTTPENLTLHIWQDDSKQFKDRINLLVSNAGIGLFLLFLTLLLFLNTRLSFWVSVGIPISFMGAIFLLPFFDTSINIVSLFAFILVLGIVVDDAVVVGESIHLENQRGNFGASGSIDGTLNVYKPILFAVITSIIAFSPLINLPGPEGKLIKAIPIVVICTLVFSLFESFYILPAHLASSKPEIIKKENILSKIQTLFSSQLSNFISNKYKPVLLSCLNNKGLITLVFTIVFILFMLLFQTGWIRSVLFSTIEADTITAKVVFASSSPRHKTEKAAEQLYNAALELKKEYEKEEYFLIKHIYTVIGAKDKFSNLETEKDLDYLAEVTIELSTNNRTVSGQKILQKWRKLTGNIDGALELSYNASLNPARPDIQIEFLGYDLKQLTGAAEELKQYLKQYDGIYELRSSQEKPKTQASIILKNNASALGLTLNDVLYQINKAFQGTEVQSVQTSDDEIDILLSLPEIERASPWHLEHLPIEYANKKYISLFTIADIVYVPSFEKIKRYERKRVVSVSAYIDPSANSAVNIQNRLRSVYLDTLIKKYPDVKWSDGGSQRAVIYFINTLFNQYLIAILGMYTVMAILFRSYSQPLIVLFAIPFGVVGAITGHLILGKELSLWSYAGMVAVSGVVVNDNLVLMDYINKRKAEGANVLSAVSQAGQARFRPILLTSLTTFFGLIPLIMESSIQAQFLKPMAISLAFGVLFATAISLLLVPSSYLLVYELKERFSTFIFKHQSTKLS